jgi:hypothetical protein
MIYHATTLRIHFINVVSQLEKGVVPLGLGYGYFCDNVVGEDDACMSKHF